MYIILQIKFSLLLYLLATQETNEGQDQPNLASQRDSWGFLQIHLETPWTKLFSTGHKMSAPINILHREIDDIFSLKLLQLVNSAVMLTVWSELDRIWQTQQTAPLWHPVYLHCVRLAPLVVKKNDWPVHNVTDRKFVQSTFQVISEGACPFQTLSVSSFPDGHKKYISCRLYAKKKPFWCVRLGLISKPELKWTFQSN